MLTPSANYYPGLLKHGSFSA